MADANGAVHTPVRTSTNSPAAQPPTTAPGAGANGVNGGTPPTQSTADLTAPLLASTSLADSGASTRPRDVRTIHLLLASLGVHAYQERVPLQLLDFAYRYTSSILSDAQHLASEGYVPSLQTGRGRNADTSAADASGISLAALRMATGSRLGYQFASVLPKETMLEVAQERNKSRLPEVDKDIQFGMRLPHERFVMTGTGWGLQQEWVEEAEMRETLAEGVTGQEDQEMAETQDHVEPDETTEQDEDDMMEEE